MGSEEIQGAAGNVPTSKVDKETCVTVQREWLIGVYFVDVISEEKTGTAVGDKLSGNTIGLSYSIAPGVSALLEHNDATFKDSSAATTETRKNTYLGLSVAF